MTNASDAVQADPWYRHPWPWLLMAGPAAVVVAGAFTIALAVQSNDGVVAEDYYKRGLAINQVIEREARAAELGLAATVSFSESRVRVVLSGAEPLPPVLRLRLVHPTRSVADEAVSLQRLAPRLYEGTLARIDPQHRGLVLEDAASRWRLSGRLAAHAEAARLVPAR